MRGLRLAVVAALAAVFATAAPAAAGPCDAVQKVEIADVRILRATEISADRPFVAPYAAAQPIARSFCRVEAVIEKEIGIELWLPTVEAWNRRLLVGGVGGQAGNFNYRELERGIKRGYVTASTDTGHKAADRHWLLGRPDRAANYAHRANHLLAVKTKAIIASVYGRAPANAFFVGCSGGGRQALTEVQRYPEDFDGVIAGAPGVTTPAMSARRMWEMQQHSRWAGLMKATDWKRVADAAVAECDPIDGLKDGLIDNPLLCRFDPAKLLCRSKESADCLSAAQVAAVRTIYAPLHDEEGKRIDDGLLPGILVTPTPLPEPFTPGPPYLAVALFGDGVHADPNWNARDFNIARDLPAIDRVMDLHAAKADIRPFIRRGGKLILYHGWADPLVAPQPTIAYYEAVLSRSGRAARESVRLFMAPGMDHCRGGAGPDLFGGAGGDAPIPDPDHDLLSALERWVDERRPPERIVATQLADNRVVRTRPLCRYPLRARYRGEGSVDDANNFDCKP